MKFRVAIMAALLLGVSVAVGPTTRAEYDIVLTDGTVLTSSIVGRTVTVPANARVQYAGDITITATQDIIIDGRLAGQSASGHAYSLLLNAARTVRVTGSIVGANGANGADAAGDASPVGGAGTNGAPVTVEWGALGQFVLADGAYVKSGDGGHGGSASVTTTPTSPAAATGRGGNGGLGGALVLRGSTALLNGQLIVGSGGNGGAVSGWVSGDSPTARGGWLNLTSGRGGAAGDLTLPAGFNLVALYNAGHVTGGVGGAGGNGTAAGEAAIASTSCGQDGFHSTSDSQTRNGAAGCHGFTPNVAGEDGAPGIIGGPGGNIGPIFGGNGGRGGSGADGQASDSGSPNCALYTIGGHGASGGDGGWARAVGGRGGDAQAWGGNGGDQGDAGDGGRTKWRCDGWANACAFQLACWDAANGYGCGHTGSLLTSFPGQGAGFSAEGGSGIISGQSGVGSGGPGTGGATGTPGFYPPQCSHSVSHTHR